jgi:hypothetical protein
VTIAYLGELTIGQALSGVAVGLDAGAVGINAALPDIAARIAALEEALALLVPQPTTPAAQLALAQQIIVGINMSFGLPLPSLSEQMAMLTAQLTSLLSQVAAVHAQLDLISVLRAGLGAGGLHALAYAGSAGAFGTEAGAALTEHVGAPAAAQALVLATTQPATFAALSQLARVS